MLRTKSGQKRHDFRQIVVVRDHFSSRHAVTSGSVLAIATIGQGDR
jgi:hypothetical protein